MYTTTTFTIIAIIIFSIEYTALRDNSVVKLPGPASIVKANGKTVARPGFVSPSLKRVMPKIISRAIKKRIKAPATANSFTFCEYSFY